MIFSPFTNLCPKSLRAKLKGEIKSAILTVAENDVAVMRQWDQAVAASIGWRHVGGVCLVNSMVVAGTASFALALMVVGALLFAIVVAVLCQHLGHLVFPDAAEAVKPQRAVAEPRVTRVLTERTERVWDW